LVIVYIGKLIYSTKPCKLLIITNNISTIINYIIYYKPELKHMNLLKKRILVILLVMIVSVLMVSAQNNTIEQNSSSHVKIYFETKNVTHIVAQDIAAKSELIPYGIKNSEELKIPSQVTKYDVVTFDSKLLNEQLKSGKRITISIGETNYLVELSRMNFEDIDDGIDSYYGILPGMKNSEILFTTSEKVLIGRITLENETYWIIPVEPRYRIEISPTPLHIVYNSKDVTNTEFTIDNGTVEKNPGIPPVNPVEDLSAINQIRSSNLLQTPPSQTVTVDILVVTDTEFWNNTAWMSVAQSIIAEANLRLSTSDIKVMLRPLYDDSRRSQFSSNPMKTTDPLGLLKIVYPPSDLDLYQSDIALYLGGNNADGGDQGSSFGFNLNNPDFCRYSWVQMVQDDIFYTGTLHGQQVVSIHEIGHLFEARHNNDSGSPTYARAYTWGWPLDKKTVMWYDYSETASLTNFSSNDQSFQGHLLGDNNHDNSRRISETRDIVANYAEGILIGKSKIGIFRNGNWKLDYQNDGLWDISYNFGSTGDIPVIVDWNGDGISDTAYFRPSNGNWYVSGYPVIHFGMNGDKPVVGDWNGDGINDIGVFRPSTGNWALDLNRDGNAESSFHFGTTGDIPVVGDWDENWHCDIGVFRPSTGNWALDTNKDGSVEFAFHFGTTGDIPVVGDWNGDGSSDAGVFRPSVGNWYMNYDKTGAVNKTFHFGITGDIPIVGNWDNMDVSTTSDVGVFRNSSGYWYRDYSDNGIVYATSPNPLGTTGDTPIIGKWI
jgi:hypothetical protein